MADNLFVVARPSEESLVAISETRIHIPSKIVGGDMSPSSNSSREVLVQLHQNLVEYFSKEELRTLCFDLGIEHENLPDAKEGLARALVRHCRRE